MQDFRNPHNTDFTKPTDLDANGYDNTPQFPEDIARDKARQQQQAAQQKQQRQQQGQQQRQPQNTNQRPNQPTKASNPLLRMLGFAAWGFLVYHFYINYVAGSAISVEDSMRQSSGFESFIQTSLGIAIIGASALFVIMHLLSKSRGLAQLLVVFGTVLLTLGLFVFNYFPVTPIASEIRQIQAEFLKTPYATEYKQYFSRRLLRQNPMLQDFLNNDAAPAIPENNSIPSAPARSPQAAAPSAGIAVQATTPATLQANTFVAAQFKDDAFIDAYINKQTPFRKANLENCQFINITFIQATIEDSVFLKGSIKDSRFDQVTVKNTHWNALAVSNTKLNDTTFLNGSLSNVQFIKAAFSAVRFNNVDISNSSFSQNTFENSSFGDSTLTDAEFRQTRFIDSHFNLATLTNVSFEKATASGLSFEAATLTDCNFKNYTAQNTVFRKAVLNSPDFAQANMPGSNFSNALIKGAKFTDANLEGSNFSNAHVGGLILSSSTNLKGSDFSNATFGNISFIHAGGITFFPANNPNAYTSKPEITRALVAVLSQAKSFRGATLPTPLFNSLTAANPALF